MPQQPGDVMERRLRELPLPLGIVEGVLAVPEERLVGVHAGAVDPEDRLRHEGRERSEEHTSELQSLAYLVCRLLLEKKKKTNKSTTSTTLVAAPACPYISLRNPRPATLSVT